MNRRSLFYALMVAPVLAVLPKPKLRCLDGAHVGTYGGITRSVAGKEYWESPVLGNSGGKLTMKLRI